MTSQSSNSIEARVSSLETMFARFVEEWRTERSDLRAAISAMQAANRLDPRLIIAVVAVSLSMLAMAGGLVMFAQRSQLGPIEARVTELGDDQDVMRRDDTEIMRLAIESKQFREMLLSGHIRLPAGVQQ